VTKANWIYAVRLRGEILNAIERNTFNYADYFPESTRVRQFGHAPSNATVGERLTSWLADCRKARDAGNMSPSTYDGYERIVGGILLPEFGAILVSVFSSAHIREFIQKQGNCTAKTIRNRLSPLRMALDDAVEDKYIAANPLHQVNAKKQIKKVAKASTFEIDPFTLEERAALLQACRNEEEQDQFIFWFETGLRPGELIAAAWPKVDWIHNKMLVDVSVYEQVEKGPKTEAGVRLVELTPPAMAALTRQKARTWLAGGRIWRTPFPLKLAGSAQRREGQTDWENDRQLRKRSWYPIMKKAGVRHRNMYQIRHTYASTHCSLGRNLFWLAGQLGHETIEILIRHYGRWIPGLTDAQHEKAELGHAVVTQMSGAQILRFKAKR
jgi:integrase